MPPRPNPPPVMPVTRWSRAWWSSPSAALGAASVAVLSDPIVVGSFHRHARFLDLIPRMRRLLMGEETSREPRIRTATLIAVLNGAATHPFVAEFDEDTLRRQLLQIARLLLPPLPDPDAALGAGRPSSSSP